MTAVAPVSATPVMVTEVPPVAGPEAGLRLVTEGAGWARSKMSWLTQYVVLVDVKLPVAAVLPRTVSQAAKEGAAVF